MSLANNRRVRLITWIECFWKTLSIKYKLMVCFIVLSIIPTCLIGALSYYKASSIINEQTELYSETLHRQAASQIEQLSSEIYRISTNIIARPEIQELNISNYSEINSEYLYSKLNLTNYLSNLQTSTNVISSIYLCIEDVGIVTPNVLTSIDPNIFKTYNVYKHLLNENSHILWTGLHINEFPSSRLSKTDENYKQEYVLTMSRKLYNNQSINPVGAIIINIPERVIESICNAGLASVSDNLYIIDENGTVIYHKDKARLGKVMDCGYLGFINSSSKESTFTWKDGRNIKNIRYTYLGNLKWILVSEIPMDNLVKKSLEVRDITFMIMLLCIPVAFIVAYFFATSLSNPFKRLIQSMSMVEKGDFSHKLPVTTDDELGMLTRKYNEMIDKIVSLIDNVINESRLKRKAELNTLQAQITPHFLYNTLNTIKCLARIRGEEKIYSITVNLIRLLQFSISEKEEFVTVEKEIEIVKSYIFLQLLAHDDKFKVKLEIEPEVLQYRILKMILQPLVENALLHGINPGRGDGIITIRVYRDGNILYSVIQDNGRGMDEKTIKEILSNDRERTGRRFSGIGVYNVNERIKMHFGEKYGIHFESSPGNGTTAIVTIPVLLAESEVI